MLVLALDTATPAVTAGLVELGSAGARVLGSRITVNARAHGELLTPHALAAVADADRAIQDLDAVVCGIGPGPFTGLRAGMVTAAALGHGLDVPVYPVCSLDAIAAEVPVGDSFLVVTDARRREVYWATYDGAGVRVAGPEVASPADLVGRSARVAGDGARLYGEVLGIEPIEPRFPTPYGLATAAALAALAGGQPEPLTPLYLRRPDAAVPGAPKKVTV